MDLAKDAQVDALSVLKVDLAWDLNLELGFVSQPEIRYSCLSRYSRPVLLVGVSWSGLVGYIDEGVCVAPGSKGYVSVLQNDVG